MKKITSKSDLLQLLFETALSKVGVVEVPRGSNSGPEVRAFQAVTPLAKTDPTGWPWCDAFVSWCILRLWQLTGFYNQGIPLPFKLTASCDESLDWAQRKGILVPFGGDPEPGDIFLSMRTSTDAVHTGIVLRAFYDSKRRRRIETIEGNTNDEGSREGYGVFHFQGDGDGPGQARIDRGQYRYYRWLKLVPESLFTPKEPRLIVVLSPYGQDDYHVVTGAERVNGSWQATPTALGNALGVKSYKSLNDLSRRWSLREFLQANNWEIDETRTRLGNHTTDPSDPRQYVFVK